MPAIIYHMPIDPKDYQIVPSEAFAVFKKEMMGKNPNIPPHMLDFMEFIFMAGASWMWDIQMYGITELDDAGISKMYARIQKDLDQFAQKKSRDLAPKSKGQN